MRASTDFDFLGDVIEMKMESLTPGLHQRRNENFAGHGESIGDSDGPPCSSTIDLLIFHMYPNCATFLFDQETIFF
jgi:hypothetical protein